MRSVIFVLLPLIPEARLRVRLAMVPSIAIPSLVSIAGSIDMEEATSGQNRSVGSTCLAACAISGALRRSFACRSAPPDLPTQPLRASGPC